MDDSVVIISPDTKIEKGRKQQISKTFKGKFVTSADICMDDDVVIVSPITKVGKGRKPKISKTLIPDKKAKEAKNRKTAKSTKASMKLLVEGAQSGLKCEELSGSTKDETKPPVRAKKRNIKAIDEAEDDLLADNEVSILETSRMWCTEDMVAELAGVERVFACNIISLLDRDCTIPFIARYRREMTGGMDVEKLRDVQAANFSVKEVVRRADSVAKTLAREGKLEPSLQKALADAKNLAEIEHLYAPHKSGSKRSLAEKARALGLGEGALALLSGKCTLTSLQPSSFVRSEVKGISNEKEVLLGFQHVAADVIAHDTDILDFVRCLCQKERGVVVTSKPRKEAKDDAGKFQQYSDFRQSVASIKPHQVLALNRGENQKVLTVKVEIPKSVSQQTLDVCLRKWPPAGDQETSSFLRKTAEDAYSRLLEPLMCRQIRSQLTRTAEKESVKVFCDNLKHLLLTPPVRGRVVMAIDPGFNHGCKLAVVSPTGIVLSTDVLHIHSKMGSSTSAQRLHNLLTKFSCETIALGNGKACRETETFLSNLIQTHFFHPLSPQYCIVNESGASVYSVTKEAEAELPGMDPNLRSAVSLARRLQDPLLEYIKVEAKHIGVGMYQHDIAEGTLKTALDEVAVECVSFVGIDLNVASEIVLRRVAGLSAAKAREIVSWRQAHGPFRNRHQLLLVKGLGPKSFEQCAGFVKILPQTSCSSGSDVVVPVVEGRKKRKVQVQDSPDPLDATTVHPESYDLAERFLRFAGAEVQQVGETSTIQKVETCLANHALKKLAQELCASEPTLQQIVDALKQPLEYDLRSEFEQPLFRQGVASLDDLEVGQLLTGRVTNCTHFGAFVDIGVGCDGLLHSSCMGSHQVALGDKVSVLVHNLDKERRRIGLRFDNAAPSNNRAVRQFVVDSVVDGQVTSVTNYGAFVNIGALRPALLHKSRSRGYVLIKGDKVKVRIISIEHNTNKISLHLEDLVTNLWR